jgi:hypothetical protein
MIIRKYVDRDLPEIIRIWNEVAEEDGKVYTHMSGMKLIEPARRMRMH